MANVEKTVFISYRRNDVYTALAVYQNLKDQAYDVFFDYRSIAAGDFEQIITSNIRARAHFLLILTPTALDRCNEPGDWLRREIELAIDEKRNIVPLFFKGFQFGAPTSFGRPKWLRSRESSISDTLTGKLKDLSRYNGLRVYEDYFDEGMYRLRTEYLSKPLDTILHPVSTQVRKAVREEQIAADKALEQIEDVHELVKWEHKKTVELATVSKVHNPNTTSNDAAVDLGPTENVADLENPLPHRSTGKKKFVPPFNIWWASGIFIVILALSFLIWESPNIFRPPDATATPTWTSQPTATIELSSTPTLTATAQAVFLPPRRGKDGMTLLYVPAGEFIMGRDENGSATLDEQPAHKVYLDAFWIDQTEVTNFMYAECVGAGVCAPPSSIKSFTRKNYFGNPSFDDYPVIYVNWNMAKTYCEWMGRRLPAEAEWEKASSWDIRYQHKNAYPWGDSPDYCSSSNSSDEHGFPCVGDTSEVGKYPNGASPYGALDMKGNVWEWVNDWYDAYPGNTMIITSYGKLYRVLRGTAWSSGSNLASSSRSRSSPTETNAYSGFRCSMDATP